MSDKIIPEYFADAVQNVSHANGVFRIVLSQTDGEDDLRPMTRILIPASQLPRMLQGLNNAAREINERVKERLEEQKGGGTVQSDADESDTGKTSSKGRSSKK